MELVDVDSAAARLDDRAYVERMSHQRCLQMPLIATG
jgi:hypothetical protein